ncbi:MAG: DUF4389 domain-containing protein [Actinomycetia bacterium]|nr:DUF4389 domain-containing protein [Actinomycetes bacterium]
MLAAGTILAVIAIVLIVVGARHRPEPEVQPVGTPAPAVAGVHPVRFTVKLEPGLSRWMWLVKWILAIPHIVVLVLLWIAFGVLTFFAAVAILFTGRYPKGIFDFNVGVLRWSWRVAHYASTGGIGSDRYPPFTLEPTPDDAVTLDITYPERLSRPLVLVKWLLAIPHLLIVGLLNGTSWTWWPDDWGRFGFDFGGGGMLGLLTLAAGVVLLFTNTYPKGLYDFIVGLNRWTVRTVAYVALMTDEYPPFRLDQGETEPDPDMAGGPVGYPEPPPVVDATV